MKILLLLGLAICFTVAFAAYLMMIVYWSWPTHTGRTEYVRVVCVPPPVDRERLWL